MEVISSALLLQTEAQIRGMGGLKKLEAGLMASSAGNQARIG
jgi:hypothetical protein